MLWIISLCMGFQSDTDERKSLIRQFMPHTFELGRNAAEVTKKFVSRKLCDGTAILAKHGDDSAFNPLIVPLNGYIFGWHDRFAICPRCVFKIQTTDQSLVKATGQRVNEWDRTIKKVKKKADSKKQKTKHGCKNNNI